MTTLFRCIVGALAAGMPLSPPSPICVGEKGSREPRKQRPNPSWEPDFPEPT